MTTQAENPAELEANAGRAEEITRARAWRHLIATTPWVAFFAAAYAYSIAWVGLFLLEFFAPRTVYHQIRQAVWRLDIFLLFAAVGVFLPAWFFFSLYGYWLRQAPRARAGLPPWVDRLLTATLICLPWWWLMLLVRDPRLVLRNYRRRFSGESLYFMDEAGAAVKSDEAAPRA